MKYSINQDTRYDDRFEIIATNMIGEKKVMAVVTKDQIPAKLRQLQYPFGS